MAKRVISTQMQEEDIKIETSLRPQTLEDYIGQEKIKDSMKVYIDAAKARGEALDHVLFYGPPGLGKTTLAGIIANEMGSHLKVTSGPAIAKPGEMAAITTRLPDFIRPSALHLLITSFIRASPSSCSVIRTGVTPHMSDVSRHTRSFVEQPMISMLGRKPDTLRIVLPLSDTGMIASALIMLAIEHAAHDIEDAILLPLYVISNLPVVVVFSISRHILLIVLTASTG